MASVNAMDLDDMKMALHDEWNRLWRVLDRKLPKFNLDYLQEESEDHEYDREEAVLTDLPPEPAPLTWLLVQRTTLRNVLSRNGGDGIVVGQMRILLVRINTMVDEARIEDDGLGERADTVKNIERLLGSEEVHGRLFDDWQVSGVAGAVEEAMEGETDPDWQIHPGSEVGAFVLDVEQDRAELESVDQTSEVTEETET